MYTTVGQLAGSDLSQNLNSLLPSRHYVPTQKQRKAAAPALTRHQRPLFTHLPLWITAYLTQRRDENLRVFTTETVKMTLLAIPVIQTEKTDVMPTGVPL
jgi:hypothetical protein